MFTGIITDVGEVVRQDGGRFELKSGYAAETIEVGASICCDGVCLTVTSVAREGTGSVFSVDVSNETSARTTLQSWTPGRAVNLERSLTLGAEMGGHVVTGHVDGMAEIVDIRSDGECQRLSFQVPEHLAHFIAPKGSGRARWDILDSERGWRPTLRGQTSFRIPFR